MTESVMMALGDLRFSIKTAAYDSFRRHISFRWVAGDRLGNYESLQFAGFKNDTVNLKGIIYPEKTGKRGLEYIEEIKKEGARGEPLLLVDGLGNSHGKWVILNIDESKSSFLKDGLTKKIEFDLAIKKYEL